MYWSGYTVLSADPASPDQAHAAQLSREPFSSTVAGINMFPRWPRGMKPSRGVQRFPGLEKPRDPGQPGSWITLLFGLLPGVQARPPTANVAAIFVVVGAEFFAQSRLFIEEHEQMYPEGD